jgi:hypothetical protein
LKHNKRLTRANVRLTGSSGCYIDLKIGGTIFSAAWICFNNFGFLSWVPEVPKAAGSVSDSAGLFALILYSGTNQFKGWLIDRHGMVAV